MEQEQNAAQEQTDNFVIDSDDHAIEQDNQEAQTTESAPVENNAEEAPSPESHDNESGFQKRINKVTADKYAEKRRADELQRKLDELQSKPEPEQEKPTLENYDYDEDAYNQANVAYQVKQELKKQAEFEKLQREQVKQSQMQTDFNERVAALNKPDFADKANAIPILPAGVADALMQAENGPELIYHLGEHLDQADALANMTPAMAMMELGRIAANASVKKEIKASAAPEPIQTLKSGSVISKERGPAGATYT